MPLVCCTIKKHQQSERRMFCPKFSTTPSRSDLQVPIILSINIQGSNSMPVVTICARQKYIHQNPTPNMEGVEGEDWLKVAPVCICWQLFASKMLWQKEIPLSLLNEKYSHKCIQQRGDWLVLLLLSPCRLAWLCMSKSSRIQSSHCPSSSVSRITSPCRIDHVSWEDDWHDYRHNGYRVYQAKAPSFRRHSSMGINK